MPRYLILSFLIACSWTISAAAGLLSTPAEKSSARTVLLDYLKALRAQDMATLEKISIVTEIPFVLGYEVVDLRDEETDGVGWNSLQSSYGEELRIFGEAQAGLFRLEEPLRRAKEDFRKVSKRFDRKEISGAELRDAKLPLDELQRLATRFKALETGSQRRMLELDLRRVKFRRILILSLEEYSEGKLEFIHLEKHIAIIDLMLQSKAGTRLFKKCRITIKRAVLGTRRGRWLVTDLDYL